MNRGYAGFYKGHYLRSSYEYAYAKYLDYHSIQWSYEDKVFDLGYKMYKPDFFFYNQENILIRIVEIKSRSEEEKDNARKALGIIGEKYDIRCELISYEELLEIYYELPFSLTSTINEWIESKETTVNKGAFGKYNGHFNLKHSKEAKRKIGEHTKKLWASDGLEKQRMVEGLRKTGLVQKGKLKKPRQTRICKECGMPFRVIITSPQIYCGRKCSGYVAIKNATEAYIEKRAYIHENIKNYIIQWSKENKKVVLSTPLNKIKTTLEPLIKNLQELYGVKDLRVISKAVFGKDCGRKELIRFMKKACNEEIC